MDGIDGAVGESARRRGLVQDAQTAQYAGMPSSALTTGVVDRVLPLDAIAPALVEITGATAT